MLKVSQCCKMMEVLLAKDKQKQEQISETRIFFALKLDADHCQNLWKIVPLPKKE